MFKKGDRVVILEEKYEGFTGTFKSFSDISSKHCWISLDNDNPEQDESLLLSTVFYTTDVKPELYYRLKKLKKIKEKI